MSATAHRILLADDHALVREGLAAQLHALGQFDIVHAWDLPTLLHAAATPPGCHLAVVDVFMPGMDGGQGLAALCAAQPALPIIVISGAAVLPLAGQWQRWPSVRAIVHKSSPITRLRAAIDLALRPPGGTAAALHWPAPDASTWGNPDALPLLSPRLLQVAQHAAQGLSNAQIAHALGLTEGSVKQYLKEVFRALGVSNRTQLALLLHGRDAAP